MYRLLILNTLGVLLLGGCPRVCPTHATRCNGQVVELCSAGGEWHPIADCTEATSAGGESFMCDLTRGDVNGRYVEGHACVVQP